MVEKVTPSATLRASHILKTKMFHRFARRARIDDATLMVAAIEVRAGRFDADLGGSVYKKRIAREGAGKSGGFRTVVICSHGEITVFAHGYAKKDCTDVTPDQIAGFRTLARAYRFASVASLRRSLVKLEVHDGN